MAFSNGINAERLTKYFANLEGCDIHSTPGILSSNKKLVKEFSTGGKSIGVTVPNGDVYFFGTIDNKVYKWKRADNTLTLVHNTTGGSTVHYHAKYFNGYLYYSSTAGLGRFNLATTWVDAWQTLDFVPYVNHFMVEFDNFLYITNGNKVASVKDDDTYLSNAFDVQERYEIISLLQYGDDLLVACKGDYLNDAIIYRWNTVDGSWTVSDFVPESAIPALINVDNKTFALSNKGNLYSYDYSRLNIFLSLPNTPNISKPYVVGSFKQRSMFAEGKNIYSIHSYNSRLFPIALCGEYICDTAITSFASSGDKLFVSAEDGIYIIDDNSFKAIITTAVYLLRFKKQRNIYIGLDSLPENAQIKIYKKQDLETEFSEIETIINKTNKIIAYNKVEFYVKSKVQFKIELISDAQDIKIDSILLTEAL